MREEISRHFDVVIVIWVLALAVGWSMVTLSHAQLNPNQWSSTPNSGPVWMVDGGTGGN
jgi:hypothetical protein